MLGIQTQGGRMKGTEESTELRRHSFKLTTWADTSLYLKLMSYMDKYSIKRSLWNVGYFYYLYGSSSSVMIFHFSVSVSARTAGCSPRTPRVRRWWWSSRSPEPFDHRRGGAHECKASEWFPVPTMLKKLFSHNWRLSTSM